MSSARALGLELIPDTDIGLALDLNPNLRPDRAFGLVLDPILDLSLNRFRPK